MDNKMKKKNIGQSRRNFFRSFVAEISSFSHELNGIPQMRLDELQLFSDDIIKKMVPVFFKDGSYQIQKCFLMRYDKRTELYQEVRRFNEQEIIILKFFDENYTIENIALHFSAESGLEQNKAYQQVKTLFIELTKYMVCFPKEIYELDG